MNPTGDHWVTAIIDLHISRLLVLDSMHSSAHYNQIRAYVSKWTEVLNQCLQELGHFTRTNRQHYNFDFHYNDEPFFVPQQENSRDCGVITCWLIHEYVTGRWPPKVESSDFSRFFATIRYSMANMFYNCRCEETSMCGYD